VKFPARLALLALSLALGACSVLEGSKIDYKSAGKAPTLEVPPDLTQLSRDSRSRSDKENEPNSSATNKPLTPTMNIALILARNKHFEPIWRETAEN